MPYIDQDRRAAIGLSIKEIPQDAGELNYCISKLLNAYMFQHGLSYARMDDCTGACGDAAAEFRRRVMDGYEDQKILANGDVYEVGVRWEKVSPLPRQDRDGKDLDSPSSL